MLTAPLQNLYPVRVWLTAKIIFPVACLLLSFIFLKDYLQGQITLLLLGATALIVTANQQQVLKTCRFAIVACFMLLLTFFLPVKTFLYLSMAFSLCFWIECYYGTIHFAGVIALFLASPAFQFATAVFSFPLRLQLAKMVGYLFSVTNASVLVKGNSINYDGREFGIDDACSGLHMLPLSILMGIILLGLLQRKTGKTLDFKITILYLVSLIILNLLSNLLRIILLVQFAIQPQAIMHDVTGLLCLLFYVCIPAAYLAKYFLSKASFRKEIIKERKRNTISFLLGCLFVSLFFVGLVINNTNTYLKFTGKEKQINAGYTTTLYAPGIIKLENNQAFTYVKFIRGFYDTEHNPTICWKGSGYEFKDVGRQLFAKTEVYTATLCNTNEKLYTAWWYGNGSYATLSQWQWRWQMLKGDAGYALINVTAATKNALELEVRKLTTEKILLPLLTNK